MELRSAGTERRHGLKKKSTFLDELVMRFKKMSRLHGVKVTPQRLIILRELALYQGHPSAEDIHGRSALRVRRISLDTVYRTLALFERLALVKKLRFLDDRPTMLERLFYTEEVGRLLFSIDTDSVSITEYLGSQGHPIMGLQHEIDAVAADDQDSELLQVPQGTPILRLTRTSRDASGKVFEASEDRYLSSIVRFTVAAYGISSDGQYLRAVGG